MYNEASSISHVDRNGHSALLIDGKIDAIASVKNSYTLAVELKKASVQYTYDRIDDRPHLMVFFANHRAYPLAVS
ncbi:hypothetical protein ND16A_0739 [Thalassotalea sp. ND16A]|nr:hypothetical protein ND16A_0739 [Thalassotalea sp. ND16A]